MFLFLKASVTIFHQNLSNLWLQLQNGSYYNFGSHKLIPFDLVRNGLVNQSRKLQAHELSPNVHAQPFSLPTTN